MPSIYGQAFKDQVAQARGRGPGWAQAPMGRAADPLTASLVAQQTFDNGPGQMDPMQPSFAAQRSFNNGPGFTEPPQFSGPKFGSRPGPVTGVPGGPSITLPGAEPKMGHSLPVDPPQSNLMGALQRSFTIGRR